MVRCFENNGIFGRLVQFEFHLERCPSRRNDDVITPCYLDAMSTASKPQARPRETLNIRIRAEERSLIDRAAAVRGTNRTDFILDAARRAAEDALLDQSLISVGPRRTPSSLSASMRLPSPTRGYVAR